MCAVTGNQLLQCETENDHLLPNVGAQKKLRLGFCFTLLIQ